MARLLKRHRGFTLIELLIVVAIIGIIAALLIPNFLEALQKAKQKRTMADEKNWGTAAMAWLTDEAGAAAAGGPALTMSSWTGGTFTNDYDDVVAELVPDYIGAGTMPERDGWKHPFAYALNTGNPLADRVMGIYSGGRDSEVTVNSWPGSISPTTAGPYEPKSFDFDIFWADGYFATWPERVTAAN